MSGVPSEEHAVSVPAGGVTIAVAPGEEICGVLFSDAAYFAVPGISGSEDAEVGKQPGFHHLPLALPSVLCDYYGTLSETFGYGGVCLCIHL